MAHVAVGGCRHLEHGAAFRAAVKELQDVERFPLVRGHGNGAVVSANTRVALPDVLEIELDVRTTHQRMTPSENTARSGRGGLGQWHMR